MVWQWKTALSIILVFPGGQSLARCAQATKTTKCQAGEVYFQLQIMPDEFAKEDTAWKIYNGSDGSIAQQEMEGFIGNGMNYSTIQCLPRACYRFTILDAFGDGIIEPGKCIIETENFVQEIQSDFGYHRTTSFGSCDNVNSSLFADFEALYTNGTYQFQPMIGGSINDLNQTYYGRNAHRVTRKSSNNVDDEIIKYHVPIFADITTSDADASHQNEESKDGVAGAMLAIKHWNEMNSVVVEKLNSVNCPIRFSTEVIDTQSSIFEMLRRWTEIISRDPLNYTHPQPSIILDVSDLDSITSKLASSTAAYDILHVSSTSTAQAFEVETYKSTQSYSFTRNNPTDKDTAESLASYLAEVQNLTYCGVIYNPDDLSGGALFYRTLQEKGRSLDLRIRGVPIRGTPYQTMENINEALMILNDLSLIIAALPNDEQYVADVLKSANQTNLLSSEKTWIFGSEYGRELDDSVSLEDYPFSSDMQGNFVFGNIGMFDVYRNQDPFLREWTNSFDASSPVSKLKEDLSVARYSYDAVISIGLASCEAWGESSSDIKSSSGSLLQQKLPKHKIKGASGYIEVGVDSLSRKVTSAFYALKRIHSNSNTIQNKEQSHVAGILHYYNPFDSKWLNGNQSLTNTTIAGKRMKQNESQKLDLNLSETGHRFNSTGKNDTGKVIRIICLSMCGILLFFAVVFASYTVKKRKHPVVRGSFSFYLILCGGVISMGSAITIPFYEYETDVSQRDEQTRKVACTSFPCLITLGYSLLLIALLGLLQNIKKVSIALEGVSSMNFNRLNVLVFVACALKG